MAACRNGGLTVAASIPRVTCVARPSLPYHTFLICPSDNHMLHSGRPPTAKTIAGGDRRRRTVDGRFGRSDETGLDEVGRRGLYSPIIHFLIRPSDNYHVDAGSPSSLPPSEPCNEFCMIVKLGASLFMPLFD